LGLAERELFLNRHFSASGTKRRTLLLAAAFLAGSMALQADAGFSSVPMDSWVYPALDRLAAGGLIPSQVAGLRPWTRSECLRQVKEAEQVLAKRDGGDPVFEQLLDALHKEFDSSAEEAVVLESIYSRQGIIAGPLLDNGFHFGETWSGDFGRPFGRGWDGVTGFTVRAEAGRFFGRIQGEYQHAPGGQENSPAVQQLIAKLDQIPVQIAQVSPTVDRFRTIEAYAGVRLWDFEISAGKQSLFWGPGVEAPLSFSDNAEPTKNLKVSTISPITLPGWLRYLGAIRGELVIGKLGGQSYTWRPWFNAQKISFKLTPNLEMGFTRWSIFWGVGHPETLGSLVNNFFSLTSPAANSFYDPHDPGDRKGGFDFRYRVPGVRDWVMLYSDSYSEDDPSPLAAPRRAAISPGIWITKIPGVPRLDLRVDVTSTEPFSGDYGGQFDYYNAQYRSGNTNYGFLLGSAVGRDGRAVEARSTYSLSARTTFAASYQQLKIGGDFLPGGGTQSDAGINATRRIAEDWYASLMLQYERFWIPSIGGPGRNLSGTLEVRWEPRWVLIPSRRTKS
jgi:Capsule assembly protein Wzi